METTQTPSALHGMRILDLTSVVFGPYASQILADYGADVIKIEPPEGDSTRRTGPSREPGLGAIFLGINRNKRSIVLDLKQEAARQALLAMADHADVVMHSMRPAKMAALGLGPDVLCARNPRLVYAGLYGFGMGGAYDGQPAYDDIIQGLSGVADIMQRQTGEPRYMPTIAADKTCGLVAAHAVLAALLQRERTGQGQCVEVPMFETMASYVLLEHFYGRHLAADGTAGYPRVLAPWRRPYRTSDGHICMMPYTDAHWQRFFRHAGRPDLADDPRFADIGMRTRHIESLYELVGGIVVGQDTEYWLQACRRLEIPAAPVNRLEDLERDPHLESVGFFVDLQDDASAHTYRFPRNPVRMQRSEVPISIPPRLGQHTREVLAQAGLPPRQIDALIASGAARQDADPAAGAGTAGTQA